MGRLHYAARRGLIKEVEAALTAGEPPDGAKDEMTPLQLAAGEGFAKIVRVLLDAGADPFRTRHGGYALHRAASGGHLNVVAEQIERGVPVDLTESQKETAALIAARFNHRAVAEYLLGQDADPTVKSRLGGIEKTVSEWLEVGGIQGLLASKHQEEDARPDRWLDAIRRMMAERSSVEEYAAHHGRRTLLYSLDQHDLSDPEADRWAKRYGEIVRSPELLAECEDRFPSGDALAEVRRRRERNARAAIRRAVRDEARERRREELK